MWMGYCVLTVRRGNSETRSVPCVCLRWPVNILHIRSIWSATEQLPFQRRGFCNRKSLLYSAFHKFIEMDTKGKTRLSTAVKFNTVKIYLPVLWCFNCKLFPQIFTFSTALGHRVVLSSPLCKLGRRDRKTYKICLKDFAIFALLQVEWTDPRFAKT